MGGHSYSEIPCAICTRVVDLSVDLTANEKGKAVHEECYVKHITTARCNGRLESPAQSESC
jgi:hypothetical protein